MGNCIYLTENKNGQHHCHPLCLNVFPSHTDNEYCRSNAAQKYNKNFNHKNNF